MKSLFILLLFCLSWQLFAQINPLVGTWQVVSIQATDSDGTKLTADGSEFKETKIITPTHYALITFMKQEDSLVFNKATVGRVRVEGNKYIEIPEYASDPNALSEKTNFTYRLEGNKFIQAGTFTTADGKTGKLDELIFQKVNLPGQQNPAIGVWNQLTSKGVTASGEKWQHDNSTHIRFLVVSPTHFIFFRKKDNKFEDAIGGSYKMEGNKFIPDMETIIVSHPSEGISKVVFMPRVEGNKLYMSGEATTKDGKVDTWEDVYEKVNGKTTKSASTK